MDSFNHVGTKNLNSYKDQINEAINSDPKFDTSNFNLSSGTSDPLPLVSVSLRVAKKHIATTVAGLTCFWDSGATDSMIKTSHIKHFERKIQSNKVEYSTFAGVHCTTHDVKVLYL